MADRETLVLIHTNPAVRLVWDHLRRMKGNGHDDPLTDPLVKEGIEELRRLGVPIPEGDLWWR